jgi:hypothetical protein
VKYEFFKKNRFAEEGARRLPWYHHTHKIDPTFRYLRQYFVKRNKNRIYCWAGI